MGNEEISFAPTAGIADRIDAVSDESLRLWAMRLKARSDRTREAVRADLLQAEHTGTMPELGEGADVGAVSTAKGTLSRDAVRAEAVYAVRHGQLPGGEV